VVNLIAVGPTAIVILILVVVFFILYRLADKVDKEEELKKQWQEYNQKQREYEEEYWRGFMWQ
jgi:flagellar biosynthesis/type III secretory pathway M-ring protein FliF/YscJ